MNKFVGIILLLTCSCATVSKNTVPEPVKGFFSQVIYLNIPTSKLRQVCFLHTFEADKQECMVIMCTDEITVNTIDPSLAKWKVIEGSHKCRIKAPKLIPSESDQKM